ncbi:isocitrate lyase/PEP mutase family protein [Agromyces bauzanensis]
MTQFTSPQSDLRHLHDRTLVLPNAWDPASAALITQAGAQAIATTSAGVAWSLGYADGQGAPVHEMIAALRRIVAATTLPVTADVEAGYDDIPGTITAVISAGASGVNIEDAEAGVLLDPEEMAARIALVRRTAVEAGVDLFVNARIDTYLTGAADPLVATIDRARRYVEAGADGIFVPGVVELSEIAELSAEIPAPLNVMVHPGSPSVAELEAVGVRRISTGMAIAQQAWGVASEVARSILRDRTFDALGPGVDYGKLNELLSGAPVWKRRPAPGPSGQYPFS